MVKCEAGPPGPASCSSRTAGLAAASPARGRSVFGYAVAMDRFRLPLPVLSALSCIAGGCGPGIKGEALPSSDSGAAATTGSTTHHGDSGLDDTDDDTGPPPRGDVEVRYELSWEMGDDVRELCSGELTLADVDTSHRTWALWTDAGLALDPDALPSEAPAATPVGDGTTVNPGAYRFVVDASTDTDLPAYDAAVAGGAAPVCLVASGADLDLQVAHLPEAPPERIGPIDAIELRLTVVWTDR